MISIGVGPNAARVRSHSAGSDGALLYTGAMMLTSGRVVGRQSRTSLICAIADSLKLSGKWGD